MISKTRSGFEGEIGLTETSILEGELNRAAVHARRFAVICTTQPRDSTVELTVDCGGALWVSVSLVKKHRVSFATSVNELDGDESTRIEMSMCA